MKRIVLSVLCLATVQLQGQPILLNSRPETWRLHLRGIGPVYFGMSISQVEMTAGLPLVPENDHTDSGCRIYAFRNYPGLSLMFTSSPETRNPRLVRYYATDSKLLTISGIQIGSSIARLKQTYTSKLQVTQNHYTTLPEFLYVPTDKADQEFRIVFETDGTIVTQISAGRVPEIGWVEGCS